MQHKDDNEQVPYCMTMDADCSDDIRDSFGPYESFHIDDLPKAEYPDKRRLLIELNKD